MEFKKSPNGDRLEFTEQRLTLDLPPEGWLTLEKVRQELNPVSVFVFGSRARNDHKPNSDVEIGIFFDNPSCFSHAELQKIIQPPENIKVYSYKIDDFSKCKLIIPFQRELFIYEVITTGVTILGVQILEKMKPPTITLHHLASSLKFWLGRASDSMVCLTHGASEIANTLFSKSCLAGTRDLIIYRKGFFPKSLNQIVEESNSLDLGEYSSLPNLGILARKKLIVNPEIALKNIYFLNKFIESSILEELEKEEYRKIL